MNNWKKERSMSLGVSNTERSFKLSVQTLLQFCIKNKWDSHSQHSGGCAVGNRSFLHKSQNFFSYLSTCGLILYIYVSVGRRDQQNRQAAITVLKFQYQRRALGGGVVKRWVALSTSCHICFFIWNNRQSDSSLSVYSECSPILFSQSLWYPKVVAAFLKPRQD